jgi:membrane-associated phospholipid phosphatase
MVGALTSRHSEWWVQVPAWTLGTGFAAQRIDSGVHWTSDVLVGAVLGLAISSFLADRHTCTTPASGAAAATSYITFGFDF